MTEPNAELTAMAHQTMPFAVVLGLEVMQGDAARVSGGQP